VVIERKYAGKIERYLKEFFKASSRTEIELVILSDEEESANVLKLLKDKINVIINKSLIFNLTNNLIYTERFLSTSR
jgi:hypothetical protein